MAVSILDSWSTQTTTIDLNFTVSSGSDRLLLVCVAAEDTSATNVSSMTFGGQTMFLVSNGTTTAKGSNTGGGSDTYLEVWGVLETEIAAASGNLIDVTMDNASISEYMISAGSYAGVDQSGNGGSGSVDDVGVLTTNGTDYSFVSGDNIQVTADGLAVMCVVSRLNSTFTSSSPLTEIFDFTTGNASSGGGGDLIASNDSAYTATITATSNNRGVGVIVTFAAEPTGAVTDQAVSGTLTPTGALAKVVIKGVEGSSSISGAVIKQVNMTTEGVITASGALTKIINKAFSGSMAMSGILATMLVFIQTNTGSLAPSGNLSRLIQKQLSGSSAPAGTITKLISKNLSSSVTMSGATVKLATKILDGSLTPVGTVATTLLLVASVAGSLTMSGILATLFIPFSGAAKMVKYIKGVVRGVFINDDEII